MAGTSSFRRERAVRDVVILAVVGLPTLGLLLHLLLKSAPWEGLPDQEEARDQIVSIINATLAAATPGTAMVAGAPEVSLRGCSYRGQPDDAQIVYHVTIGNVDIAAGDELVTTAKRVWREHGLEPHRDDYGPGPESYAYVRADGFEYELRVDGLKRRAFLEATTPCIPASDLDEAGFGVAHRNATTVG